MTDVLEQLIRGFNIFVLGYFIVLQLTYTVLAAFGWRAIEDYVRRRPMRDYDAVGRSEMSMPVSILVPAYNEAPSIVSSVNALLRSQFLELEVVTINDGSTDSTLDALIEAFDLVQVDRVPRSKIPSARIRAVYTCPTDPRIVVIDKENGGKADSLNVGIKYAKYPLFCAVDADTMLDAGALSRLVWEFQASPDTVAVGGIVRIVNGSTFDNGRLDQVKTPTNLLANLQILEYLRAFLGGRIGWSKTGMLLIVSGAFGLFRRDVVVEVGGYDPTMVGEDAELILRLHRHHRELSRPCRITFFPDPICWTECPEDLPSLVRQRDRWQRGLIGMIVRHKDMIGRPRYGRIGLGAMPYYVVFELLGPTIECLGYVAFAVALSMGLLSVPFALAFMALSLSYGLVLTFLAILMEERAFRRYPSWRDLGRLVLCSVIENFGYRQLLSLVRLRSWYTVTRNLQWGEMTRKGFGPVPAGAPAALPAPAEPTEGEALDVTAEPALAGETPAVR